MNELSEVLLIVIAALAAAMLGIGTVFARQILAALNDIRHDNRSQWEVIRAHDRELGGIEAVQKMRATSA